MRQRVVVLCMFVAVLSISRVAIAENPKSSIPPVAVGENPVAIATSPICYVSADTSQGRLEGDTPGSKLGGLRVSYGITVPHNVATGIAHGSFQQEPLTITMPVGAATPQLFHALLNNEMLKQITIEFIRSTPGGKEVYYTLKLDQAMISSIHQFSEGSRLLEDVSFTFQRIDITYNPSKKTTSFDLGKGSKPY